MTTTAAVLSAELDASGFREGGREVRRTLEEIGSGVRAGMSDMEAYNRIQGAAGASAVETARSLGLLNNALRDAERAFNEQARHVGDLSRKFDVLRAAAGESVAALQRFGKTNFTADLSSQITRLSTDMARVLDAGGKGAVAEARRIGREMADLAKQQLAAQGTVAEQEAKAKVEAAKKAAAEIGATLKGQKTEEAAIARQAAQEAIATAKADAAAQIAAAKQTADGVLGEMRRRTEELIRLKQRETQAMGEYERAHARMRSLERNALETAARATEAEIAHTNATRTATAETDRFAAMAQRAIARREANTQAIQRETQALQANAAVHHAASGALAPANRSSTLDASPSPPLPNSPAAVSAAGGTRHDRTDLAELANEVDRVIQRYDYLTAATHRRTEALATLAEARRHGVIDDDEEYERLTRLVSGQQRHAEQLDQVRRSLDPAAAAQARYREEVERVSRILDANRVDEAERARILRQVADAHDPAAIAARKEAEALRALEDRLDRAGAAARRMREEQERLDRALTQRTIGPDRHAELTRALEEQNGAITGKRGGRSANSRALTALVPQINDIAVTAAMGMNPGMILIQQGPQIIDVLMMAGKEAAMAAARFALLAAPIIAAAGALALYEKHRSSLREMDRANDLQGAALGMTSDQMDTFATAAARAGEISVTTSRSMVSEYTRVGKIAPDVMGRLIAMNRDYATLTGQDTAEATKKLAGYMADPAKAAEELADSINLLSDAEVQRIKTMTESGERTAAQTELVAALERRTRGAAEQTSFWARAWHSVSTAASNAADSAGRYIDGAINGPSREDRIRELERMMAANNANMDRSVQGRQRQATNAASMDAEYRDLLIQKAEDERRARSKKMTGDQIRDERELNNLARSYLPVVEQTQVLEAHQQRLQRRIDDGKDKNGLYARSLVEVRARLREVAEAATPVTQAIAALEAEAVALNAQAGYERGLASRIQQATQNGKRDITTEQLDEIQGGYNALKRGEQRDALEFARQQAEAQRNLAAAQATGNEVAVKKAEIDVRLIELAKEYGDTLDKNGWRTQLQAKADSELTGAIDAQIAAMGVQVESAKRIAAARAQGGEAAMAAARADNVFAETLARTGDAMRADTLAALEYRKAMIEAGAARAEWNRTLRDQSSDLSREADAWTRGGAAAARRARLGTEALTEIRRRGTRDPGEVAEITEGIGNRDTAQRQRDLAQMATEQRQQVELARVEFDLLGKSNAERAKATAELEAQRRLMEAGADLTDQGTQAYVRQAGELARAKALIEEQAQIAGDFGRTLAKGVEDAILDGGKGALEALAQDIRRIFVRATITKPLETAITGELTRLFNPGLAVSEDNTPKADRTRIDSYVDATLRERGALPVLVINGSEMASAGPAATIAASAANSRANDILSGGPGFDQLVAAVVKRESNGNPNSISRSGKHFGLMQIGEAAATDVGWAGENLMDPEINRYFGAKYLRKMIADQGGDVGWGLAAYNAGAGNVAKWRKEGLSYQQIPYPETRDYVAATMGGWGSPDAPGATRWGSLVRIPQDAATPVSVARGAQGNGPVPVVLTGGGSQTALGSATALLGSISGVPGGNIAGQVIAAGGPSGIMQSLGQLGSALGIGGVGSLGDLGKSVSGLMNQTLYGGVPTRLMDGIDDVGQLGYAAGTPVGGVTVGNAISGGLNAISAGMDFANGRYYSGAGNSIAAIMSFIPGLQAFAPLAAIGGSILESLLGKKKQEYPVAAGGVQFVGGSPAQWSGATDNGGDAGAANQIATGIRESLTSYFDATNARQVGGLNIGIENKNGQYRPYRVGGSPSDIQPSYGSFDEAMIAAIRREVKDGVIQVGVDEFFATMKSKATELDKFMQDIEFGKGFETVIRKWMGAMDPLTASFETGAQSAQDFGKELNEFLKKTRELFAVSGPTLPAYAAGTLSSAAGPAWVGEEGREIVQAPDGRRAVVGASGPEIVTLPGGSRVWNARKSAAMLAAMGEGRDTELVHVRPDELAWMHRTLGGGRINPRTGLAMFLEGETGGVGDTGSSSPGSSSTSSGPGSENAGHGTYGATTADRDAAYGGGWGSGGGGSGGGWFSGFMAAVDRATTAIGDFGRSLGLTDREIGQLSVMSAISPSVGFSAVAAATYGAAYGLGSIASAISGEPMSVDATFSNDTMGSGGAVFDRATAESALTKLSDVLAEIGQTGDAERINSVVGQSWVGQTHTAGTIADVATIANGNEWSRVADGLFTGTQEQFRSVWDEINAGMKTLTDAGLPVPKVLSDAAAGMQRMAEIRVMNGIDGSPIQSPEQQDVATAKRDRLRDAIHSVGLGEEGYNIVTTTVNQLSNGSFSPVGRDFEQLARQMRLAAEAFNIAGQSIPDTLQAAIKQMDALAAAKSRIDAQIANPRDETTDWQKKAAEAQGYWSSANDSLVKAMEAVGYQGELLGQKLQEGLGNAMARLREDYEETRDDLMNSLKGESWKTEFRQIGDTRDAHMKNAATFGLDNGYVNDIYRSQIRNMLVGLDQGERDRAVTALGGDAASVAATLARGFSSDEMRQASANATRTGSRADARTAEDMQRTSSQAEELNRASSDAARAVLRITHQAENAAVAAQRNEQDAQRNEDFATRRESAAAGASPYDRALREQNEDAQRARAQQRELRLAGSDDDRRTLSGIFELEDRAVTVRREEEARQRAEGLDTRRTAARAATGDMTSYDAETARLQIERARELRQAESDLDRQRLQEIHTIEEQARTIERARQVRAFETDLAGRAASVRGNSTTAALTRFDAQSLEQIEAARRNGMDVNSLVSVLAAERRQTEFDVTRADYLEALDRQARGIQDQIDATEKNTGWLVRLSTSFRDSINSARLSESSPYGLEARLLEARRLFEQAVAKFNDTSLPQDERERQAGLVQTYGQARIELASQFYGSTDRTDFDAVMSVWASIGGLTEDQVDATRIQLARLREQIDELKLIRDQASRLGERQIGSVDSLKSATTEALARLNSTVAGLTVANDNGATSFATALQGATSYATLDPLVQLARTQSDPERLRQAFNRADELGIYRERYGYSTPSEVANVTQPRWDQQATDDALHWLEQRGYSGGWTTAANIFVQSRGLGTAFTDWQRQYAQTRGWMQNGGIVQALEAGGVVGNGIWGRDSVQARYAGGGVIELAGGEGVLTAAATRAIGGESAVDYINRHMSLPANDDTDSYVPMAVGDYEPAPHPEVDSGRRQQRQSGGGGGDGSAAVCRSVDRLTQKVETLTAENRRLMERLIAVEKDAAAKNQAGHERTAGALQKAETRRRGQP